MAVPPLRVGVVFGGDSGEHAVSIRSARTVIGGLRSGANAERYAVSCFYIDRAGRWWPASVAEAVLAGGEESVAAPADAPPACMTFQMALKRFRFGFRCCMAPMAKTARSRDCSH